MRRSLLQVELGQDRDIVAARQRAREISALTGFDVQDQVRIATAVSELARNALRYAGGGKVEFMLETVPLSVARERGGSSLKIVISDNGPGLGDFEDAICGATPGGEPKLGLVTARRMVDSFQVESVPGRGTTIALGKMLPKRAEAFTPARVDELVRTLAAHGPEDPAAEIQQQNRELLRSLDELRVRQEELARLNAELEDTNRGVMALYAELDERAAHLRAADETKTRFLSSVSHEFRTPVNSILALSKILLHRLDGNLSAEQERQVRYICQAAEQLVTLIDDLLDLRKVESGTVQLRAESFAVEDLLAALRGMFKPLAVSDKVALIFDEPVDIPQLHTDQGKVAQILRNLVSNALKFTERGSVRVSARYSQQEHTVAFEVADTGVGIAPENHRRIFEEFTQVDNPLQAGVKGTGLGLPLSQRLAGLLGGSIELRSGIGVGSAFSLVIPARLDTATSFGAPLAHAGVPLAGGAERALIIDDNEIERYALRQFLAINRYEVIEAVGGYDGLRLARQCHPDVIFLDLVMPDLHGFEVLKMLKAIDETRGIPVVIFTSQRLDATQRERAGAADALLMKSELSREAVANLVRRIRAAAEVEHAGT